MPEPVQYALAEGIATLTLDDGKANALSIDMIAAINAALDRAVQDRAAVLLAGRAGTFSAGFDLKTMAAGGDGARRMLRAGFELGERLLSFRAPVVAACTGHALAMGSFLLLSVDERIGADGAFRIGANEVAIGLTMPRFAIAITRQRLAPAHFHRAVINAEIYTPADAVAAGFLDRVVAPERVLDEARAAAVRLARLPRAVHTDTKLRAREPALREVRAGIEADDVDFSAFSRPR